MTKKLIWAVVIDTPDATPDVVLYATYDEANAVARSALLPEWEEHMDPDTDPIPGDWETMLEALQEHDCYETSVYVTHHTIETDALADA